MTINKQQVQQALTHVMHPSLGKDLVTLKMIQDLVVQDKFITFTVELAEDSPKIEAKIRDLCEDAVYRYVDEEAVVDIQTKVNPFRQKEIEDREVQELASGANPMNMSEPTAENHTPPATIDPVPYEDMPEILQHFMDEHEECLKEINHFEEALQDFKKNKWVLNEDIHKSFSRFFTFMDNKVLEHNRNEEKTLFPLLQQKLMASGEHSQLNKYMATEEEPRTAVEIMEDEHVKFIQLSSLTFNFLGLAPQLPDARSQSIVSDLVYEQGIQLIETLRLHIQRENKTLFPLACKLISDKEFNEMELDKV